MSEEIKDTKRRKVSKESASASDITVSYLNPYEIVSVGNARDITGMKESDIAGLAKSILQMQSSGVIGGLLQPVQVYYDQNTAKFVCLDGHRRLAALRSLKEQGKAVEKIPAIIVQGKREELGIAVAITAANTTSVAGTVDQIAGLLKSGANVNDAVRALIDADNDQNSGRIRRLCAGFEMASAAVRGGMKLEDAIKVLKEIPNREWLSVYGGWKAAGRPDRFPTQSERQSAAVPGRGGSKESKYSDETQAALSKLGCHVDGAVCMTDSCDSVLPVILAGAVKSVSVVATAQPKEGKKLPRWSIVLS